MRRVIAFPCEGKSLIGSLDEAPGETGLLIVSGGNEPRMGAHRGMALLASRVAARGWPVFRFDRRGIGDSDGENGGWSTSAPDIEAAAATFRHEAGVKHLVGFGNCDAATALALFGEAAGIDTLVLANPWLVEREFSALPPAAAIRARYAERLRSQRSWVAGFNPLKLGKGLRSIAAAPSEQVLAHRFADALTGREAAVVLAKGDATAIAYGDAVKRLGITAPVVVIETDSHSFAREGDAAALETAIVEALRRYSAASANS